MGLSGLVGSSSSRRLSPTSKMAVRTFWSGTSSISCRERASPSVYMGMASLSEWTAMPRWSILPMASRFGSSMGPYIFTVAR
ncbi:hypothetical protein D3C86_1573700 [compost metagenome]